MANNNSGYIPGTCNIGRAEVNSRKVTLLIVLVISFAYIFALQLLKANHFWRLLLFFPASATAVSYFQVFMKFCVAFGWKGVFNFGETLGKTTSAELEEYIKKDRSKTQRILLTSVAIGAVATVIYYFLPV